MNMGSMVRVWPQCCKLSMVLGIRYGIGVGWILNSVNLTLVLWPWPIAWTSLISFVIKISWYDDGNIVNKRWQAYRGIDGRTDGLNYSQSCVVAAINFKPASRDPAIKASGQTSGRHEDIYVMATSVHEYVTAIYSVHWSKTNARDYFLFTQCRMPWWKKLLPFEIEVTNSSLDRRWFPGPLDQFIFFFTLHIFFLKFFSVRCVIPSPVQPFHHFE